MTERLCPVCTKPTGRSKLAVYCKPCADDRVKNRTWEKENPHKVQERNKKFYAKNQEREKARAAQWKRDNPNRVRLVTKVWRELNAEQFAEMKRAWREANSDYLKAKRMMDHFRTKEHALEKAKAWKNRNKAACRAHGMKRAAIKKKAVPLWVDQQAILKVYQEAARLTIETGVIHHVDHIVPLQSDRVCGLHWHGNLQVLTAWDNQSKKNYWWPDMPQEMRA